MKGRIGANFGMIFLAVALIALLMYSVIRLAERDEPETETPEQAKIEVKSSEEVTEKISEISKNLQDASTNIDEIERKIG
tara:strand:- start:795 stop:1034 length:240 start_codon:yes stop_codon:yes gene_type:complete